MAVADRRTPAATITLESHFMLILFRYAVSVASVVLCVALWVLPGISPIVAPAMLPAALIFAVAVVLPVAIGLRLNDRRSAWAASAAGGLLGIVPGLMGVGAGALSVPFMMVVGAAGGLAAWGLAKLQAWPVSRVAPRYAALTSFAVTLAVSALAAAGTVQALALIAGPKDLSCHNIARNGGRSFPVALVAKLRMEPKDWPRLHAVLTEAAATDGWSMRDYRRPKSYGAGLCQEAGTNVTFQQWIWNDPPDTSITIRVTAPQGGAGWKPPTDKLLARLAAEWPGALTIEPTPHVPQPPVKQSSAVATPAAGP